VSIDDIPDRELIPEDDRRGVLAQPGEPSKRCCGLLHPEGVYLTLGSFYKNRGRDDGLNVRCIDCERAYNRRHADRRRETKRRYERNKKTGLGLPVGDPKERLTRFIEEGVYEPPDADGAEERLRRYMAGEEYRRG